jgi:branched-chain amino acid transport system substrate-binding protein
LKPVATTSCGPIVFGGEGKPDYLIVSDLPLRAPPGAARQVAGIQYVLRRRHYRAGDYSIGYQSCDNSSAAAGGRDLGRCSANAKAWSANRRVLGVIGPYNSECAALEIPVADAAPNGPLAMIGTGTTDPQLTTKIPGGVVGAPGRFYPAGSRNFVRLTAPDQFQAAAAALFARAHGLRRVYVLSDGEPYGDNIADWFADDARRLGVTLAGTAAWNPKAKSYDSLVASVAAARPDGVFLSGFPFLHGGEVLKELRHRLGSRVVVFSPDGFSDAGEDMRDAGKAANGLYVFWAGVPAVDAGRAGRTMLARLGADQTQQYGALYGAAAASVLLDAIARADGSRAAVTRGLFRSATPASIIGRFGFDEDGDPTVGAMTVLHLSNGKFTVEPTLYPTRSLAKP